MPHHEPVCVGEKTCTRCGETKHVLAFSVEPRMLDGLKSWCRDCCYEVANKTRRRKARKEGTLGKKMVQSLNLTRPGR